MKAAETPADPIAAALAKYQHQMELPELTATAPDEVLIAHLARGQPTTRIQTALRQAQQHARNLYAAPADVLDDRAETFWREVGNIQRSNPEPGGRKAADWHCAITLLRMSLQALAVVVEFTARWEKMSDMERQATGRQESANFRASTFNGGAHGAVVHAAPDWTPFLAQIRARGVTLAPAPDGGITLTGGHLLTPIERTQLVTNKPTIRAALGAIETI